MASIEQYKDKSDFYNYLLTNPWMRSKQMEFKPTLGQSIAEIFGDYSASQNYYGDLLSKQNQWFSEAYNKFYEQEYNSAAAQVQREKAAGLNPDINGQVTPGASSENDQPILAPPQMGLPSEGMQTIGNIVSSATAIVSTAFNFYAGLVSLKGVTLENDLRSLNVNKGFRDTSWSLIKEGIGEFLKGDSIEAGTIKDKPSFVRSVSKFFRDRLERYPFTRAEKRKLAPIIDGLIRSTGESGEDAFSTEFESLLNTAYSNLYNSRGNLAESAGRVGTDKETVAAITFMGREIYKPMIDLQNEVNKLILQNQKGYASAFGTSEVDPVTGEKLDSGPVAQAKAEKYSYRFQSSMSKVKLRVEKAFEEINKKITGSKKLSEGWKLALQAGVSFAESQFLVSLSQGFHLPSGLINHTTKNYNSVNNTYDTYVQ